MTWAADGTEQGRINTQAQIAEAVRARGYLDDWTEYQHAARQPVKLVEEAIELLCGVSVECQWTGGRLREFVAHARELGQEARALFDTPTGWAGFTADREKLINEAADVVVVLCCLVWALGEDVDLLGSALKKARGDVPRGRR